MVFNIGNPQEITMVELATRVAKLTGRGPEDVQHLTRGADDPERRRPDISKMRSRYGWEPRVGLEEGLTSTIDYFRSARTGAGAGV
jgi:nucleoside-diphosphate-sugar epimerase